MADKRQREQQEQRKTNAKAWAQQQAAGGGSRTTAVKLPGDMKFYKLEQGIHVFDVMPFLAGPGNPRADEGFEHFEREYEQHRIPTPDGNFARVACNWACFRKECRICKHRQRIGYTKENDPLRPQRRNLFVINDKPGDQNNPLKCLDAVYFNRDLGFGQQLVTAINATANGGEFADLRKGLRVQVVVTDSTYMKVARIDLLPRDYKYPSEMLKAIPCPDSFLVETPDAEVAALLGENVDGSPTAPPTSPKVEGNGKPVAKEPEPEEDEEEEETDTNEEEQEEDGLKPGDLVWYDRKGKKVECEVIKVRKDGKLDLEDDEGEPIKGADPAKCVLIGDEDEEEEPDEEPDEDSEDEEESDEPLEEDEEDEDEEEEEESEEEDSGEDEEDEEEEEEEEEDEPPAKKPSKKPAAKAPAGKKPARKK